MSNRCQCLYCTRPEYVLKAGTRCPAHLTPERGERSGALTLSTSHFPRSRSAIAFVCALAIFGLPSCQSGQFIERLSTSPTQDYLHTFVQKGTTTLRDGQQTEVRFNEAFESVPRLTIVGFNQSWFQRRPYAKDDFEIVQLNSASFTVQNNHREQSEGSWAIMPPTVPIMTAVPFFSSNCAV